jgi:hypothetical protein
MKNIIAKIALSAAFLGAIFIIARDARFWTIAHAQSGGYTITMNLYNTTSGQEVFLHPTVYARRADGTKVHLANLGMKGQPTRQISLMDGHGLVLFDGIHAKVLHTPKQLNDLKTQAQIATSRNGPCEFSMNGAKKISDETLLGYRVTVVDLQDDPGIRERFWLTPELGCATIQYQVERLRKDGAAWDRTLVGRATNIRVGEPDSRLFDLGDKYESVTRDEAEARLERLRTALSVIQ